MPKIVFFEVEDFERESINNNFSEYQPVLTDEKLDEMTVSKYTDAEIISTFIYSDLKKDLFNKLPKIKLIATRSTGFDHIDLEACKEKGIIVSNVPNYGAHTVAEHTFALILSISRKIVQSVDKVKKGDFSNLGLTGFDLYGKTLGIVGAGGIGKNVALLGIAFGMKVLAYGRSQDQELLLKGVKYVLLDELLGSSDIVSLHLPFNAETEHIINRQNIDKFKKNAVLINTARGALVETQAILEGLEKGILSGAGLDVLEEEAGLREERELLASEYLKKGNIQTELVDHVLLNRDDVIVTPHNAFNSKEALNEILETSIGNIKSYISGAPKNKVE